MIFNKRCEAFFVNRFHGSAKLFDGIPVRISDTRPWCVAYYRVFFKLRSLCDNGRYLNRGLVFTLQSNNW